MIFCVTVMNGILDNKGDKMKKAKYFVDTIKEDGKCENCCEVDNIVEALEVTLHNIKVDIKHNFQCGWKITKNNKAILNISAKEIHKTSKKYPSIVPIGSPGCAYTGGGCWVSYVPIMIDGKTATITYNNEALECDDKDIVEFTVYDYDPHNGDGIVHFDYMLEEYFDNAVYVEKKKKSPYVKLFDMLQKALKTALKNEIPFDSDIERR